MCSTHLNVLWSAGHGSGRSPAYEPVCCHSAQAVGHGVVGSAKLTSAAVAVPLVAVGAVGAVSSKAGNSLMEEANKPIGAPLEITDEALTVGPSPDQAIH